MKKINSYWNDLTNYRPVSNIGFVGKIIEKAAIDQVNEHMQGNDLDDLFQSAYKNKHSTETALLMVTNGIEHALDDNNAVFLVMLDLSAAFDTIDHDILICNVWSMALVSKAQPLIGFHSYITGHHFRLSVGGNMSEEFILEYSVPQGSIIGPKVFTMYSQYVSSIIRRNGLNYHIYADDVQIFMSFDPNVPGDAACAILKIISCVEELREKHAQA